MILTCQIQSELRIIEQNGKICFRESWLVKEMCLEMMQVSARGQKTVSLLLFQVT